MNAYLLTVLVVDHEGMGPDSIKQTIEAGRYLNPTVTGVRSADIGEWADEHPLNYDGADVSAFFPAEVAGAGLDFIAVDDMDAPEVITFEGMTPGEQWFFVFRVAIRAGDSARSAALGMATASDETHEQRGEAIASWPDDSDPGYQARYDAALAHVRGVMDAD